MVQQIFPVVIGSALLRKRIRFVLLAAVLASLLSFSSRGQDMNNASLSRSSVDEQCTSNLRHIYRLLKLHRHHSGGALGFPSNLDVLYGMSKDPHIFICPSDKEIDASMKTATFRTSYEIVNDPLKPKLSTMPPDKVAIVAEKRPNHNGQRFVLFYDGSVRGFDTTQFDKLKSNGFIATDVLR